MRLSSSVRDCFGIESRQVIASELRSRILLGLGTLNFAKLSAEKFTYLVRYALKKCFFASMPPDISKIERLA
jgi:hypothetical protein